LATSRSLLNIAWVFLYFCVHDTAAIPTGST